MDKNLILMALACLLAGIGIPTMAAINGQLSGQIGLTPATVILFSGALVVALLTHWVFVAFGAVAPWPSAAIMKTPAFLMSGGLFVAFYVLTISYAGPRLGLGTAIFIVLFGQIIAASLIDHFGFFGKAVIPLSPSRIVGILVMAAGIILARK